MDNLAPLNFAVTPDELAREKDGPPGGTRFGPLGTMRFCIPPAAKDREDDLLVDLFYQRDPALLAKKGLSKVGRYVDHVPEFLEHGDERVPVPTVVVEGRGNSKLSLKNTGFELVAIDTKAPSTDDLGWASEVVKEAYERSGRRVREVLVFDHMVRDSSSKKDNDEVSAPVSRVHCDYTRESGPKRLKELRPDLSEALEKESVEIAFANVWRSTDLDHPVKSWPLALMDPKGIDFSDSTKILPYDIVYPNRTGQNYSLGTNVLSYEWYYFKHMTSNEALVFSVFDSDSSRPGTVFHTAFEMPPDWHQPWTNAPPPPGYVPPPNRESIECRTIVVLEKE